MGNRLFRSRNLGKLVKDTGNFCIEDNELPIRIKLQVSWFVYDDYAFRKDVKSWKEYRRYQYYRKYKYM